MRIHLAALAAASLFVLAVPRPPSQRAMVQGIPLGDLVRVKPDAADGDVAARGADRAQSGHLAGLAVDDHAVDGHAVDAAAVDHDDTVEHGHAVEQRHAVDERHRVEPGHAVEHGHRYRTPRAST